MSPKMLTDKLSSLDLYFLAMEDVMPAQGMIMCLRFVTKHSEDEIYQAMRSMLSVYPRLRSLIQPTLFSYRLRILDDKDKRVDVLFRDAIKIKRNVLYDSEEFRTLRRELYNAPFTLEQSLPIKILYLPDDPQPVLIIIIHHVVCDGMGSITVANAVMEYLNGKTLYEIPLYNPSIFNIFLEKPLYKIPLHFYRSLKSTIQSSRQPKLGPIMNSSPRPSHYFGPIDIYTHKLPFQFSALRNKAKELQASLTNLILLALAITFSRSPGKDSGEIIGIRLPIDHRQYLSGEKPVFGNYAVAPMFQIRRDLWGNPRAMLADIKMQMNAIMQGIQKKEGLVPYLIQSAIIRILGRKFYAWAALYTMERGLISKTATLANIGKLDGLNMHGTKAQISEFYGNTISYGLFIYTMTIGEDFFLAVTYQESEFNREEIEDFIADLEQSIREILAM